MKIIKVPTIFALSLLITLLSMGLLFYSFQKSQTNKLKELSPPKDIKVLNLTDTQSTITWNTDLSSEGEVLLENFPKNPRTDDRDPKISTPHLIHFVTLKNLTPNTKYSYKIKSGNFTYPDYSLDFKTAPKQSAPSGSAAFVRGTILNTNLNPIDEALVLLKIEGAQDIGGITGTSGNFIIPLGSILSSSLSNNFNLTLTTPAILKIQRGNQSSEIKMTLPLKDSNLPPITIGQNLNLSDLISSSSAELSSKNPLLQTDIKTFDLNQDGILNVLDSAIITNNINKKKYDKNSDLNKDQKVDQKDLDLIIKSLQ